MRPIVLPAMFLLFSSAIICADENDDIVNGCSFSNAEFGTVAIQICIEDNQAARAAVAQYPESAKDIVARCVRGRELGWSMVKLCIDKDIEAEAALANYATEHDSDVKACKTEFGRRVAARVKACVDQATEAAGVPRN
jgi:hypothetical protein